MLHQIPTPGKHTGSLGISDDTDASILSLDEKVAPGVTEPHHY
jgi:hypothetical protein